MLMRSLNLPNRSNLLSLSKRRTLCEPAETTEAILRLLFRRRRLIPNSSNCAVLPCPQCVAPWREQLHRLVAADRVVQLVLPAFPAKSPSTWKVLGTLPDRAEEIALDQLQWLCDEIQRLYAPGAHLTICSDGHVFSDLVGVSDATVTEYQRELNRMIRQRSLDALDLYSLDVLMTPSGFDTMRIQLLVCYGEPIDVIHTQATTDTVQTGRLNGIERFLLEEGFPGDTILTRSKRRKAAHERALHVIQRSDAWSHAISKRFPDAIRLSIHPQPPHSDKIGILLGDAGGDTWITPWHGTAVLERGRWMLERRCNATSRGAQIVERYGRPYYLEIGHETRSPA